ncbi:hypothetical protein B0J14DRAFT_669432 [Halenospora varia]|nr:hypothetical protein B0J14DRAFT_669432 [Halenospora varia]
MFFSHRWSTRLVLGTLCLVSTLNLVSALDIEYCSNLNTASTNKNSSIYQSNGLCHDFCIQNYAFAVLQDDGCWCSNYAPGTTTTGCNTECPGYKYELCGGSGLYGYIALTKSPSGTQGAASSKSSTAVPVSTCAPLVTVTASPNAVTIVSTFTAAQSSINSSTSSTPSSTQAPTTSSTPKDTTSSSSTSSTWTPTPVVSLKTVTGQVQTVTITPTVPPNSQSLNGVAKGKGSGGLSTGGAVGLTVGLVALVAVIGAMVFYYIRKRRQEKAEAYNNVSRRGSVSGFGAPQRSATTMSENSRYVLGTDGTRVVERWEEDPDVRRSRLMPVDPRLDPFAPVYQRGDHNKSRESVNTIRDDHDYSRRVHAPLRATNPDT